MVRVSDIYTSRFAICRCEQQLGFNSIGRNGKKVRMPVPKMVKNGFNSAFRLQKDWLLQRKYELRPSSKLPLNPKRRIKTILHQFRSTHAR